MLGRLEGFLLAVAAAPASGGVCDNLQSSMVVGRVVVAVTCTWTYM